MTYQLTTSQKRWATLGIGMSAFMIAAELYIVGAMIPILVQDFNTTFATAEWIILIYTLVLTVLVLGVARLGDIFDKKLLFLSGLVLFTISSLLCGLAPNIAFLIAFRGLQGLGAVLVWALRNAIISEIFPEQERGRALGSVTGLASLGLALGPGLGGLLISLGGWRLVFWVNLPIGILASVIVARYLPSCIGSGLRKSFDVMGLSLMSLTLSCFVLGITRVQELGFGNPKEIILIAIAAIGLVCFLLLESRLEEPILDIKMLRLPSFSFYLLLFGMIYMIAGIIQLALPLFLELVLHFSPQKVGLLLTVLPLASVIVAPIAGSICDYFGERIVSLIGLLLIAVGCFAGSYLNVGTTIMRFCIQGILIELGLITSIIPISNTIMDAVEREKLGIASGLLALSRTLGIVIGTCLFSVLFSMVTISNAQSLTDTNITSVSQKYLDITTVPVAALIKGIDTIFVTMTIIAFSSITLAVFLWWQSKNYNKTNTEILIVTSKN
ncbi:MAG: DHA2 family efflux MFS transporter permease subunit [Richelia sp. RM2_1_2]|nr:DHA2 family efflux MFS transporter permease subunit [Richelia sp. RM2_1_2]